MTAIRSAVLVGVLVVCLVVSGAYFVAARRGSTASGSAVAVAVADFGTVLSGPRIAFRNAALGSDYSKLALVPLADPGGPRAISALSCERLYTTATAGICVTAERGVAPTYGVETLDAGLQVTKKIPLVGQPSRARMSVDGRLTSTTTFVSGHSYAATSFSTETTIRDRGKSLGSLESWRTTLPNGSTLDQVDRNYWGVTFDRDDEHFFATAASGGTTWLVRGSLADKQMTALRTDAECPSLSPDGTKIAYKKRLGETKPGVWRLAVLDLRSNGETILSETRSVDDQVEWLDNSQLLYALPRSGSEATTSDVWVVPADGTGAPRVLIKQASSPAVVRT